MATGWLGSDARKSNDLNDSYDSASKQLSAPKSSLDNRVRVSPGRQIGDAGKGQRLPSKLDSNWRGLSDQHFERCRVPEETVRTGARTIRAGLENHHQIARLGNRKIHPVGQQVEWCA